MNLSAPKRRFLEWLQRIAKATLALRVEGGVKSAGVLLRVEVDERGRTLVQLKKHHSSREYGADWPAAVGGAVEVRTPEALGALFEEVWHALHEKANGWEGPEGDR